MAEAAPNASNGDVSLEFMSFNQSAPGSAAPSGGAGAPAAASASAPALALGRSPLDDSFSPLSLLQPSFYVACFDVDEGDVLARVRSALWPFRPPQPFLALINPKPDLYGPVWLSASLVFMIAVGFNMASWLNFRAATAVAPWEYDFKALTKALFFVYGFSFGAPTAVWLGMSYSLPKQLCLGLVSLTCVYGYSIAPFIPAAVRAAPAWQALHVSPPSLFFSARAHCTRHPSLLPPPPLFPAHRFFA
jgi:hypothetical protein